jgi:transposase
MNMINVGIDWAEDDHQVCILDVEGATLEEFKIRDGAAGVGRLHERIAEHVEEPGQVIVGIETDRGLLVGALVAAGYQVYAVNPMSVDRYRDRHTTSGGKSDRGDARVLADLVRTDRHNHRTVAADSELLAAIKVTARTHQNLIWTRTRHSNQLRSALREFYPAALEAFDELAHRDALAILAIAPTPEQGRRLSTAKIRAALERAGRQRNLDRRATEIRDALRSNQLEAPPMLADAFGDTVAALVPLLATLQEQIGRVETVLADRFEQHPDAELILSLPGLSIVLGARVLAEFGDAPNRYSDAKARRNYAGTSPITKASGRRHVVVARFARNHHLADACDRWAGCALSNEPGTRAYHAAHNPDPESSKKHARRKLANKLVGLLHGVLEHRTPYDPDIAWRHWHTSTTTADTDQVAA